MALSNRTHQRQPQSHAAVAFAGTRHSVEGLENAFALILGHAGPAVLTGLMLSFLVYVGAVIWVFAVRSATRAWVGLAIAAVPLGLAAWWVTQGGAA